MKKQAQQPAADVCRSSPRIDIPHNRMKRLSWLVVCLGSENKLSMMGALYRLELWGQQGGEDEWLKAPETRSR